MTAEVQYQCRFDYTESKSGQGPTIRMHGEKPALAAQIKVTISDGIFAAPLTQSVGVGQLTTAVQGSIVAAAVVRRIADLLDEATGRPLTMQRVGSPVLTTGSAGGLLRFRLALGDAIEVQIQVPDVSDFANFAQPAKRAITLAAQELRDTAKTYYGRSDGELMHDLLDKMRSRQIWTSDPNEMLRPGLEAIIAGD
ncbi:MULTISPECIES: hypothetical protein [unclassified Inquilinus]|uniref:hypothetical protein n=1 Tax=unclassified Inquilinus TaxID=2645927 RepID=UPI003F92151F